MTTHDYDACCELEAGEDEMPGFDDDYYDAHREDIEEHRQDRLEAAIAEWQANREHQAEYREWLEVLGRFPAAVQIEADAMLDVPF